MINISTLAQIYVYKCHKFAQVHHDTITNISLPTPKIYTNIGRFIVKYYTYSYSLYAVIRFRNKLKNFGEIYFLKFKVEKTRGFLTIIFDRKFETEVI